jgi:hypothetical protein
MSITDTGTERAYSVHATLALNPTTLDAAEVRRAKIRTDNGHPIIVVSFGDFTLQTHECDPLAVADAFDRLANRIRDAVA